MKTTILKRSAMFCSFALLASLAACSGCGGGESTSSSTGTPAASSGAGTAPAPAAAVDPAKAGSIAGKVKFEGVAPVPKAVEMGGVPECAALHPNGQSEESLLVKDGMLKNVIVYVKEGLSGTFAPPATSITLDQHGCMYGPHVQVCQTNQPIDIKQSDPGISHNVHAKPVKQDQWNFGMSTPGVQTKKFKVAEIVKFQCDVHSWMTAYIGVFDHPYAAVTDESGAYEIKNLPPGEYVIEAWHEKWSKTPLTQKVKVGEKETKTVDFSFKQG